MAQRGKQIVPVSKAGLLCARSYLISSFNYRASSCGEEFETLSNMLAVVSSCFHKRKKEIVDCREATAENLQTGVLEFSSIHIHSLAIRAVNCQGYLLL